MVDAGFGEDVDPAVVWVIEEGYGVVHGGLVDSSWPPGGMTIDGEGLSQSEEERVYSSREVSELQLGGGKYGFVNNMSTAPSAQRICFGLNKVRVGRSPHSIGSSSLYLAQKSIEELH